MKRTMVILAALLMSSAVYADAPGTKLLVCGDNSANVPNHTLVSRLVVKLIAVANNIGTERAWIVSYEEPTAHVSYFRTGTFYSGGGEVVCQQLILSKGEQLKCRGFWGDFGMADQEVDGSISISSEGVFLAKVANRPLKCELTEAN